MNFISDLITFIENSTIYRIIYLMLTDNGTPGGVNPVPSYIPDVSLLGTIFLAWFLPAFLIFTSFYFGGSSQYGYAYPQKREALIFSLTWLIGLPLVIILFF